MKHVGMAFGVKPGHVNLLYFTKTLDPLEEHSPPFHQCGFLKEGLLPLAACLSTQGLPWETKYTKSVLNSK